MDPNDIERRYDYYFLFEYEVVFVNSILQTTKRERDVVISKVTEPIMARSYYLQLKALENALYRIKERYAEKREYYYIDNIRFIKELTSNTIAG